MQYMLIFFESPDEMKRRDDPAQSAPYLGAWRAYIGAMQASGIMQHGNGLQPPHTASTVRVKNGQRVVQDGPFADTREHLGGYFVVDVPSLEVALEWAARAPCATTGGVEVRPVLPPMSAT
jgi:hypothetical protein